MDNTIRDLKITLGTDNFEEMVTKYNIFVDKTLFIKEIIESDEKAILITYPRRWGKTLNLDMLKTFFIPEDGVCKDKWIYQRQMHNDKNGFLDYFINLYSSWRYESLKGVLCRRDLFTGGRFFVAEKEKELRTLLIASEDEGEYMQYQGKYPVIFLSLKDVVADSLEEFISNLKSTIKSLYKGYRYLSESDQLTEDEKLDFQKYIDQNYNGIKLNESIKFLSELLYKHHGRSVYIFIDEYDRPINKLLEGYLGKEKTVERETLIKSITELITSTICSSVSKTNPFLEKLILTGIFDTTLKESGSGCNNVKTFGVADSKFSPYFGFSEREIRGMTALFHFKNRDESKVLEHIKDWYNGYTMPIVSSREYMHLYTPWAVMNYLDDVHREGENYLPRNYWSKSGASTILQSLFSREKCLRSELSDKLMSLSVNQSYELKFDPQISLFRYNWFTDADNEEFFSYLLLNAGYLTVQKEEDMYRFSIPNAELLEEFTKNIPRVGGQCSKIVDNLQKTSYLRVLKMIHQKDSEGVKKELSESHLPCEDKSMNFNLFHLTAIFGDAQTFKVLLESSCKKYLDFSNDQLDGLKAIDYAFLLRNDNVTKMIQNHYQSGTEIILKVPNSIDTVICSMYYVGYIVSSAIGLTFTKEVEVARLGAKLVPGFEVGQFAVNILNGIADKDAIEQHCNRRSAYRSIDTTHSSQFDSLKQYEKYLLEHPGAQVVLDGQCPDQQEPLSQLSYGVFENSFYSKELVTFTLCPAAVPLIEHWGDEL